MAANLDQNPFFQLVINPAPRYRFTRHGLLWSTVGFFVYTGFAYIATPIADPAARVTYAIWATLFFGSLIGMAYLVITGLVQRFILLRFRFGLFVGGLLGVHIVISGLVRWHFQPFVQGLTLPGLPRIYGRYADYVAQLPVWQAPIDPIIVGLFSFSLLYNYLLYAVGFKVFKDLFVLKIKQEKLEKENIQLEFSFLKAQLNPHFLFNTLNNIYSFSIASPDKVANALLKLADLMRYALYETEAEFVPLTKELQFLDSYVQLQRWRHETHVEITYSVQGVPGRLVILPLLLIVFVENAFKHGPQASAQGGWVHVDLRIDTDSLAMRVVNNLPAKPPDPASGIGLQNARKRIDRYYPNRSQLTVSELTNEFRVTLTIQLHEPALPSHYR